MGAYLGGGGRSGAQRRSPRVMGSGPLKQFPLRRDVGRFLKEKTHNPGIDRVGHLRQVFGGFRFCFPTFWTPSAPHKAASMKRGGGRVSYLYPGHPLPVPRGRLACCRPVTPGSRNGGGGPGPSRPSRLTSVTGPWEVPPPTSLLISLRKERETKWPPHPQPRDVWRGGKRQGIPSKR